ncbi:MULTISPECIES: histidine phosphatase family protein [Rubrivivax]|uniref:Histidine phosphatase family protein n=1 Tax=Rubrivivax benzoatilyticus TaxID=316997 RepID=A0ABX0HYJ7_9BURK|nr:MULTISPECIES: histidine phosphatase family protein [Rubrivivax]EGJ11911.1 phosphoglycerate mutase [Rubrivivax benzoatilyticus JA2 = ATCC BAA-35]NHL00088.1 histidine phosphatase family protein [Rubrivivax benzoatilyticus]NHL25896.1 histidine phosphatase family protein [Rubrivivax benzoatilyticus]
MNEATRLVVLRHGETDWNVGQRIQGQLDIGLNGVGRWQAGRAAAALLDEGLQAIYSSDLARAADTAAAISRATGLPVHPEPGLRERGFGRFEGLTFAEIQQRWPEDALRWRRRDPDWGAEGGERLADFYGRAVAAALAIAARHPGQTVALVAHGGVLDCLYRAATRIALDAPRTWMLGNASINRLLHADGALALVGWNDAGHLEGGRDDVSA